MGALDTSQSFVAPILGGVGAIVAAIIAGLFAFLGLVIAKENKTSELRQSWIDGLRSDIAAYAAAVKVLIHVEEDTPNTNFVEYIKAMQPVYDQAVDTQMRIRLRINPQDPNPTLKAKNEKLLNAITEIQEAIGKKQYPIANARIKELHEYAAPVLKEEWERVKRGEDAYVQAKK